MINRRVASLVYLMNAMQGLKTKGSFIATQLNSTSSWVELRRYKRALTGKEHGTVEKHRGATDIRDKSL